MPSLPTNFLRDMCAYCGSRDNLDSDHVPPKNLFLKPRPTNIITVPACPVCHSGTSKDDEYFRLKLCLRSNASEHPKAKAIWNSIFRSLNRKEATGLRSSFLSDIRRVRLHTQAGLYIGSTLAHDVDVNRIRRVVERTVRGLYFAESCNPLGLSNEVSIYTNEDISADKLDELNQTILTPLAAVAPKVIGDNVFLYRFHIENENPVYSVWGLSFYAKVPFLCFTGPHRVPLLGSVVSSRSS
ncbi:hypothetical protein BAC3_01229 [uncultured bacterium]|nr:hypothetical protein BAC3_01229 [uncultured bacterium]